MPRIGPRRQPAGTIPCRDAAGLGLALVSARWLEGQLFGIEARDPLTLSAVTLVVAIASLAACLIPGRRAVRVDPMVALRAE